MDLEITGRGMQVTVSLRQQAEEGLARIEKVLGPKCTAKIVLHTEKQHSEAEVTVRNTMNDFASHTSAKEITVALKDALDKVELQAVKARKKVVTTMHHPEHSAKGSIRLQDEDVDIREQGNPESERLQHAKTGIGKAIAGVDDGELHAAQDVSAS